jgi:hypothetical protein
MKVTNQILEYVTGSKVTNSGKFYIESYNGQNNCFVLRYDLLDIRFNFIRVYYPAESKPFSIKRLPTRKFTDPENSKTYGQGKFKDEIYFPDKDVDFIHTGGITWYLEDTSLLNGIDPNDVPVSSFRTVAPSYYDNPEAENYIKNNPYIEENTIVGTILGIYQQSNINPEDKFRLNSLVINLPDNSNSMNILYIDVGSEIPVKVIASFFVPVF